MRNLVLLLLAAAYPLLVPSKAEAQTRPGFEINAELFDYAYRERFAANTIVKDDGTFGSVGASYVETIGGGAFLRGRLQVALGSVDYRGSGILDDTAATESRLDNVTQSFGQLEIHLAKNFVFKGGATITPFVGIGSRYFEDESGGKTTDDGLAGYDRRISYAYLPIGVGGRLPLAPRLALVVSGQFNLVTHGRAESRFSDTDPEFPDVKLDLTKGKGVEASALLSILAGQRELSFGPFVRHWSISRSKTFLLVDPEGSGEAIEFFEPKNRTTEFGLRASFGF